MKDIFYILIIISISIGLVKVVISRRNIERFYNKKYRNINSVSDEVERLKGVRKKYKASIENLKKENFKERERKKKLCEEINIYEEKYEEISMGVYEPFFDFDSSEDYKKEITRIRDEQKKMLKDGVAIVCGTEWEVGGSRREGKAKTKKDIKLTSRAFNNECEAAIANTRWNNANAMLKRINSAYVTINKLNDKNDVSITDDYLTLKLKELRLVHEMKEKKQEEKEIEAERRRLQKEEEKLAKEALAAQNEEDKYSKLLEKAKKEAASLQGEELDELNKEILKLKEDLFEAHQKTIRAKSMAEQTKQGHVYVISNEGSFGKGVYKIGMTRRLDPMDRVKELGDASVPFTFDTHAMIYSKDAPGLENELHKRFCNRRVNMVNKRKEFFRVEIEEIEEVIREFDRDAVINKQSEAREFRETLSILKGRP